MTRLLSRLSVLASGRSFIALAGSLLAASSASAAPISVGTGAESANVVLNFSDGASYEFVVSYATATTTGEQLLRTIDTLPGFTLGSSGAGGSFFVTAIAYDGHTDGPTYVPPEGFWHYWTKDLGQSTWTSAMIGAGTRTIDNGDSDGWVFGSASAPVPEPASLGLAGVAVAGLLARRRRTAR